MFFVRIIGIPTGSLVIKPKVIFMGMGGFGIGESGVPLHGLHTVLHIIENSGLVQVEMVGLKNCLSEDNPYKTNTSELITLFSFLGCCGKCVREKTKVGGYYQAGTRR